MVGECSMQRQEAHRPKYRLDISFASGISTMIGCHELTKLHGILGSQNIPQRLEMITSGLQLKDI
jgi:hypothetical protein